MPARSSVGGGADAVATRSFPVVGIGASAGGLNACRRLIDALPVGTGMAFILVQHLDPNHESMMADLLVPHTEMPVQQAVDFMPVEADHLYLIPPGTYLAVTDGLLRLSQPPPRPAARLPFDFLLASLAEAYGPRAMCVVLSGAGADGSLGLRAIHDAQGCVVVQDPDEAEYEGMPQSAIATGLVDCVRPAAEIPAVLLEHGRALAESGGGTPETGSNPLHSLSEVIALLRSKTPYDFALYKPGTLLRRIQRRMDLASIGADGISAYLTMLRADAPELDRLAKDLLINVTCFFRDPQVFALLAETVIPELVRDRAPDQPLRIWITGCSTGEETYSLAILFREAVLQAKRDIKLQVFASDVDPDAIAVAREGLYPAEIAANVSPARLSRFFAKDGDEYRVLPELRSLVVFTVQDVLADPPFARLDLVSCRNLLIYMRPEAQTRIISLFHFALRPGGILLLGSSETVGVPDSRFAILSKPARIYRHTGRFVPGAPRFPKNSSDALRVPPRAGQVQPPSRQAALADLCRRLVTETHAPAAVLINGKAECLYSLGPTDLYLRMPPGNPSHDLLAMARGGLRNKLRAAIHQASQDNTRVVTAGGEIQQESRSVSFNIDVQPATFDGEQLLLVCFVDTQLVERRRTGGAAGSDAAKVAELELELEATRQELRGAIRTLEISAEEQAAINEEALSVNEEYQSTNEELLTSKEELQSLNEELTALNGQLQETLERQRMTSNDLQNVLYSTEIATLFLDTDLNIRFFTPATKSLFRVIPGDVGRPLADLKPLAADAALLADAETMLRTLAPVEREIETEEGAWYSRRVLPYRTHDNGVEGVVITFTDITERKEAARELEAAKQRAELANVAKSRFLAAASHDLRQPLQSLSLVQGILAKKAEGQPTEKLVTLMAQTLGAMSGMLNTLLDINQIDSGAVEPDLVAFRINDLLRRLRDEFGYHAQAQALDLRVTLCGLTIVSDRQLLEQMIRNLLSNAMKYTKRGRVLLGCRRQGDTLRIEVWDTGIGIPAQELDAIFAEYHQVGDTAHERSRGLGLGLSIVERLAKLLDHRISVRSQPGKGSVFAIEVPLAEASGMARKPAGLFASRAANVAAAKADAGAASSGAAILVAEDDPEVRELIDLVLRDHGHRPALAGDGREALATVERGALIPDILLADFELPNGMTGLQLATELRTALGRDIPVIILTADISTGTMREIARANCVQLNKPVKLPELTQAIQRVLSLPRASGMNAARLRSVASSKPIVFVVDDDVHIRGALRAMLEEDGREVRDFASCEAFLQAYRPEPEACLILDANLPGMSGLDLMQRLQDSGNRLPTIMITGGSDVPMAVRAMKAGACDLIEKPIAPGDLLAGIERALEQSRDAGKLSDWRADAAQQLSGLSARQRQIMDLVLAGQPSKTIAADLGISQRTVENHRAAIMHKTGSKSLPALARLALAAASHGVQSSAPEQSERRSTARWSSRG